MPAGELMGHIERTPQDLYRSIDGITSLTFAPVDLLYALFLLCYTVGWSALPGLILMLLNFVVQEIANKVAYQSNPVLDEISRKKSDKLDELFTYIKQLKLFGWQKSFEQDFENLRAQ
jgi:hypothetical protein